MPLDERAAALIETLAVLNPKPVHEMTVTEARNRIFPLIGSLEPVAELRNLSIPVRHGQITGRLYVPKHKTSTNDPTPLPLLIFMHGGGWVLGDLVQYDQLCCALAARSGSVVVSLDYRLAPETVFPGGFEDCLDASRWLCQQQWTSPGQTWTIDPARIFIGGDSAGGNLAAAVAHEFRRPEEPDLRGQILIYPVTDCDLTRPSYAEFAEGFLLTTAMMDWFWNLYCPDESLRSQPTASPLRITSLEGLPAALVFTCECDPLRDEGNLFADRLHAAGVPVVRHEIPGMIHGFLKFLNTFPQAGEILDEIARWMRSHSS